MQMKTLALAMAAAATLAFTAPGFAASAAPDRIRLAQADVNVGTGDRGHDRGERRAHREHRMHRDVRMHRDFDRHEGRRHGHHGNRVVIIKKHHGGKTVIKKKVEG
jgi:hypothetical protein